MSVKLHHKSWVTIKEELEYSDTVIIPPGSMEAHGDISGDPTLATVEKGRIAVEARVRFIADELRVFIKEK